MTPLYEVYAVKDVVVTHLHYDHIGNFDLFPGAMFHLQDKEMNYATGRHMAQPVFRGAFDLEDVVGMVRRGWVVVASDASHLYANMEQVRPFPIVYSVADMVEGYRKLRELADSPAHIIPGTTRWCWSAIPRPPRRCEGSSRGWTSDGLRF